MIKRLIQLNKHLEKNKKDKHSKKAFETASARIRIMIKYYKEIGKLPEDWKCRICGYPKSENL